MQIESITRELILTNDQLQKVSVNLLHEFHKGLSWDTHCNAAVKMFPTYVTDVPNGKGNIAFRICIRSLHKFFTEQEIKVIKK